MSIAEVAKKAGVSYATAWRVINGKYNIPGETAQSVSKAIEEMGFSVEHRRRLRRLYVKSPEVESVALLHFRPATTLGNSILYSVQKYLASEGINLVFAHVNGPDDIPPAVRKGEVHGILGYGEIPESCINENLKQIPAVWMMSPTKAHPEIWGDRVSPDNFAIGTLAGNYLVGKGHQHVAMMGTDENYQSYGLAQRWSGLQSAVSKKVRSVTPLSAPEGSVGSSKVTHALKKKDQPGIEFGSSQLAGAAEILVDQWQAMQPRPVGVFVSADRLLFAVYEVLLERGIKIGQEIDLVSCDYEQEHGQHLRPMPCWIDLNRQLIARWSVERLVWQMNSETRSSGMAISVFPTMRPPT